MYCTYLRQKPLNMLTLKVLPEQVRTSHIWTARLLSNFFTYSVWVYKYKINTAQNFHVILAVYYHEKVFNHEVKLDLLVVLFCRKFKLRREILHAEDYIPRACSGCFKSILFFPETSTGQNGVCNIVSYALAYIFGCLPHVAGADSRIVTGHHQSQAPFTLPCDLKQLLNSSLTSGLKIIG